MENGVAWYSDQAADLPADRSGEYPDEQSEQTPDESTPARNRKRTLILVSVMILLLFAGAGGYYFAFMGKTPPPKKVVEPFEDEKPEPPPALPPVESPIVKLPEIVVPEAISINADRLFLEYSDDPKGTDAKYAKTLLEVRGNCLSFSGTVLEFQTATAGGDRLIGGITAKLPAYANVFGETPELPMSLLGGCTSVPLTPPRLRPIPGRPVAVRGTYSLAGRLINAVAVRFSAPADEPYLGKPVLIDGIVFSTDRDAGTITMIAPTTTPIVNLTFRFLTSKSKPLDTIRNGDRVTIGGTCSGREWQTVRIDNCALDEVPGAGNGTPAVKLLSTKLIAEYEADLLRFPPIPPESKPIRVTAEQLASEYRTDSKEAEERYAFKRLILTGYVLPKDPRAKAIKFETGTDSGNFQVRAAMLPADFERLPADEPELCVQGNFYGRGATPVLQLEDAKYFDPDAGDPNIQRLTSDYFPLTTDREWGAVRVVYTEPPPPPVKALAAKPGAKPKPIEHAVTRLHYRLGADLVLRTVQLQAGIATGAANFPDVDEEVAWIGKPVPLNTPNIRVLEALRLRATDWYVEVGIDSAKPGEESAPIIWQPLLRLNSKQGRTWGYDPAPGVRVKTTVESFGKDPLGRPGAKLVSSMTDDKQKGKRLETTITLVKGIGETNRVVALHDGDKSRVVMEQRMVGEPKGVDPKSLAPPPPIPKEVKPPKGGTIKR